MRFVLNMTWLNIFMDIEIWKTAWIVLISSFVLFLDVHCYMQYVYLKIGDK